MKLAFHVSEIPAASGLTDTQMWAAIRSGELPSLKVGRFSGAERGKFLRKDAVLELPVYLEAGVRDYLTTPAPSYSPRR
ncbi:MAG: hypothetical protein ABI885_04170 [Gammaproteobacteria bacterium]